MIKDFNTISKENIDECWKILNLAQNEVCLRFTKNDITDRIIRDCYDDIEKRKDELRNIARQVYPEV